MVLIICLNSSRILTLNLHILLAESPKIFHDTVQATAPVWRGRRLDRSQVVEMEMLQGATLEKFMTYGGFPKWWYPQ